MAIIIETCPKCGHDLMNEVICTYPPIPKKSCWNCGWHWEGEPEHIMRVPFGGNSLNTTTMTEYLTYTDISSPSLTDLENTFLKDNFENDACVNCSNNPKNGGTGICFCTLGQQAIY